MVFFFVSLLILDLCKLIIFDIICKLGLKFLWCIKKKNLKWDVVN